MCSAPYNPMGAAAPDWGGGYPQHQQQHQQQQHPPPMEPSSPEGYAMNFGTYDYTGVQQSHQQQQAPYQPMQQQQQQQQTASYYDPYASHPAYTGQMFVPDASGGAGGAGGGISGGKLAGSGRVGGGSGGTENFEDEPPLLEELGINFDHITQKTLMVLNPLKQADVEAVRDTDLAGPLVFCLAFGGALLLAGKLHFGYIYGIGVTGCLALYLLLNLMNATSVQLTSVMSTLGYCLLPMCLLSLVAVVLSLRSLAGILLTCLTVAWCAYSSSKIFVTALSMDHQRLLVAYPCALVYGVFALLTVF